MIVGVDAASEDPGCQGSDGFIGVHVCAGAGAGLEDIEGEMGVVDAVRDCGRAFDEADCADEVAGEAEGTYREVFDGALGLGGVEGVFGHPYLAEAVMLNAEFLTAHKRFMLQWFT